MDEGKDKRTPIHTTTVAHSIDLDHECAVILFDCYCHTFDEVVHEVMKAVPCSYQDAHAIASRAQSEGKSQVCKGTRLYCGSVAGMLSGTGLTIAIVPVT